MMVIKLYFWRGVSGGRGRDGKIAPEHRKCPRPHKCGERVQGVRSCAEDPLSQQVQTCSQETWHTS